METSINTIENRIVITSQTSTEELKQMVRTKYAAIASQGKEQNLTSCYRTSTQPEWETSIREEEYASVKGYIAEADLGLGCGLPTKYAQIEEGDTVVDLGSGAGNDCFIAHSIVGDRGKVIGIDITEKMVERARHNTEMLGFTNVEFSLGDIENLPVDNCTAHVVISNCVLNLVPDKENAFAEAFRILKPGGRLSVSDIVLEGQLPASMQQDVSMYIGCISGAIQKSEYLSVIEKAGFENIRIQKEKAIILSDDILKSYLSEEDVVSFKNGGIHVFAITVYAEKPGNGMGIYSNVCC